MKRRSFKLHPRFGVLKTFRNLVQGFGSLLSGAFFLQCRKPERRAGARRKGELNKFSLTRRRGSSQFPRKLCHVNLASEGLALNIRKTAREKVGGEKFSLLCGSQRIFFPFNGVESEKRSATGLRQKKSF
jgi:hypothetical protein